MIDRNVMTVLVLLGLTGLVLGCGGEADRDGEPARPTAPRPGVYTGTFPCADCAGLDTTLWLRDDGTFFHRQRETDATDATARSHNLGRWHVDLGAGVLTLNGAGPARRFTVRLDGTLALVTSAAREHVLSRDPVAPELTEVLAVDGEVVLRDGRLVMTECLSGLTAELRGGADHSRLRRRFDSLVGRGTTALVELEGRYTWARDGAPEALSVERFFAIRPFDACVAAGEP